MPWLLVLVLALAILFAALSLARWRIIHRIQAPPVLEPFAGNVYRVGSAMILERPSAAPKVTVVCMHGYLENYDYFTTYYTAPDIQLILISSADYHAPAPTGSPAWVRPVAAEPGTIEHDAEALVQALEHLPKAPRLRVHGHSRGGAVVLEASAQRPDLFAAAEVVLEAPVLPGGKTRTAITAATLWALPFIVVLWRKNPISKQNKHLWGRLDNPAKRRVVSALAFNPQHVRTMLTNLTSIAAWTSADDVQRLRAVRGKVLVPGDDQVLDPAAMQASAERAQGLQVVPVPGSSHFVLYDAPQLFDLDAA